MREIITVGLLASPPVRVSYVNWVESRAATHYGVNILVRSKLIFVVGVLAAVPSFGICQDGFNFSVNVVFLD